MTRHRSIHWLVIGSLATALPAFAAPVDPDPVIEEVVVRAQKRDQAMQEVPIALTVLGSDMLDAHGIRQATDIADITPGLYYESIGLRNAFIFMRGTGSGQFDIGSDSSVSVFIDEVYTPRFTALQFDLVDVDRIEVLKGPQGALFGRNTTGGAISVVTAKPTSDPTASATLEVGEDSHLFARASVSGPLGDGPLSGRLGVATRRHDGWVTNEVTDTDHLDTDSLGLHGQLRAAFEQGELLLGAVYTEDDANANTYRNVTPVVPFLSPASPFFGNVPTSSDPEHQRYDTDGFQDRETLSLTARLDVDVGFATLTSLTGYTTLDFSELHDLDGTEAFVFNRFADEESDSVSQELRLTSTGDGAVDWLVGAFYFSDDASRYERWTLGTDMVFALPVGQPIDVDDFHDVDTRSWAVFGQVGVALAERFRLEVGTRYGEDEKESERAASPSLPTPILFAPYTANVSDSWDSFDPKVTLQYFPNDDVMVYASYGEGFKSGGFQPSIPANAAFAEAAFEPEEVASYEVGVKATLWDRARINAAAFHVEYEDLQFIAATGTTPTGAPLVVIANAAESTTDGFEIDADLVFNRYFRLSAGYAYLEAEFDDYLDGSGNDQSGNRMIRTPEHQGHVTADVAFPLGGGQIGAMVSVRSQSRVYFNPENSKHLSQRGYEQLSGRLGYDSSDDRWSVSLWGRNLTDEEVCANVVPLLGSAVGLCSIDSLRSYGVGFTYRWL